MGNGFKVRWVPWSALLSETNTFATYNQGLYTYLQENPFQRYVPLLVRRWYDDREILEQRAIQPR
jgi:hypothetical protein